MTLRVRFAPSPTGYLHIGGARTALYNYLLAKSKGGKYVLRIEDTDEERSKREYEDSLIEELKWFGIEHDIGPGREDEFGPYRQSERYEIYKKHALELVEKNLAFYDFCTDAELEEMRKLASEGEDAPYSGKWRNPEFYAEAKAKIASGELAPIRFKVDPNKAYTFTDKVRGEVTFPGGMVGDFVILRSTGIPTFNFCNVIDDHHHQITNVLRAEEHLNNTVRQLMIYEAFGWTPPTFAHLSIMVGSDRQKLSKRHGATSVKLYKEEGYLAEAMANYLCLLGWSHPEEKSIFTIKELESIFDDTRFNKSPAMYDIEKLKWTNGQHLKLLSVDALYDHAEEFLGDFPLYATHTKEWKQNCLKLFIEKINVITELKPMLEEYLAKTTFEKNEEILSWPTTNQIAHFLKNKIEAYSNEYINGADFDAWMNTCKTEMSIKGKPLFMGFRYALTGQDHGPDLKLLIPLIDKKVLLKRLEQFN